MRGRGWGDYLCEDDLELPVAEAMGGEEERVSGGGGEAVAAEEGGAGGGHGVGFREGGDGEGLPRAHDRRNGECWLVLSRWIGPAQAPGPLRNIEIRERKHVSIFS